MGRNETIATAVVAVAIAAIIAMFVWLGNEAGERSTERYKVCIESGQSSLECKAQVQQ